MRPCKHQVVQLVRFPVQADVAQAKAAHDRMATFTKAEPGFICREVLIETADCAAIAVDRSRS